MYPVKPEIAKKAHVGSLDEYRRLHRESIEDPETFWRRESGRLDWLKSPEQVSTADIDRLKFTWFEDGTLNACVNCVDRHLETRGDKPALIWARDEPGEYVEITYRELYLEVCRFANVLKAHGVERGDRVAIYLGMMPELAISMLACARIGAVHSVVFGGFSAEALRDRIVDAGVKVVVTANEGLRGGRSIPLKATVDRAVEGLDEVESVLVAKRTETEVPMLEGRDHWLRPAMDAASTDCPAAEMDAESPLFILYTSGSTGKPKGVMHTTAGYLLWTALTHQLVFDLHEDDVYACVADCGWITGHSYIVYGPLANGATSVMFESTPKYPAADRYWRLVDDLGVTIFYTAPTAIRAIAREGDSWLEGSSRASLRILGTVGEPINPEIWKWYHDTVGGGRCAIVDTWWQTETGGIMISPLPGAIAAKPGSATLPFFGVDPLLVDESGHEIEGNGVRGNLCIRRPWPGMARTLYGDHERYRETYFSQYPGLYFTGDGCRRDEDGYYWITGRVDDVMNVSGHRLGTAEVESALVAHAGVAEAAVVGYPHEIKGTGISAYVLVTPEYASRDRDVLIGELRQQVRQAIGPFATPDHIQVAPGLPKTRSGKIMRRILREISAGNYADLGDLSTLAEPGVVDQLVSEHQRGKA